MHVHISLTPAFAAAVAAAAVAAAAAAAAATVAAGLVPLARVVVVPHEEHVRPVHGQQRARDGHGAVGVRSLVRFLLADHDGRPRGALHVRDVLAPPADESAAFGAGELARDAVVERQVLRRRRLSRI